MSMEFAWAWIWPVDESDSKCQGIECKETIPLVSSEIKVGRYHVTVDTPEHPLWMNNDTHATCDSCGHRSMDYRFSLYRSDTFTLEALPMNQRGQLIPRLHRLRAHVIQ